MHEAVGIEPGRAPIKGTRIAVFIVVAALALVFSQLFQYYWQQWNKDHSPFGYGYLVPPTVLFLLWCKRRTIAAEQVRAGSAWILPVIVLAMLAQIAGIISAFNLIQSVAFFVMLLALPYYLWGSHVFAKIWGPLAFTATMIPWPDQLTSIILLPSQMFSTKLAAKMLGFFDQSTTVMGTNVYLSHYNFEVAKACSGLTILFPVIAIAILNCMMVQAAPWRKALLLLLAVPISMFANALRIAIIGLIGNGGGEDLANKLHDSSGLFGVFLAVILLSLAQWWLKCLHFYPDYMPKIAREEDPKDGER